jgi:hypothetical protein
LFLALSAAAYGAGIGAAAEACINQVYLGFDSRLEVDIAGKVPVAEPPVGFEIAGGRPLIAFPHRLIAIDGRRLVVQPSLETVQGLTVDGAGVVRIQAGGEVRRLGSERLVVEGRLPADVLIHNSGAPSFLMTRFAEERTRLVFAGEAGSTASIDVAGQLQRASVNANGLGAVVGDALVTWIPGSTTLNTLAVDSGLRQVIDLTVVGPNRVVVALPHVVMLITDRTRVVLAGIDARVRWDRDLLYLLDRQSGIVWTLGGLDAIGTPEGERARARQLASRAASSSAPQFLEAVRLAGCAVAAEGAGFKVKD